MGDLYRRRPVMQQVAIFSMFFTARVFLLSWERSDFFGHLCWCYPVGRAGAGDASTASGATSPLWLHTVKTKKSQRLS